MTISPERLLVATAMAAALTAGLATPASATYSLVWADEFNGSSLDTNNWVIDIGTGCPSLCGWGNNELQYYRAENVAVTGGNLVLTAKSEFFGGSSFTSGKVKTEGKHSFLYGRIEMRAKIPTGGGMWPAFWMLPENDVYGGWAASGEIDIMEAANATTSIGGTIHYGGSFPANTSSGGSYSLGGANFADAFHIYAIEWEPDEIRWYCDGVLYYTRTSSQWYSSGAPGDPQAPFDQDFHILLNAAVGGNYTGCITPGCITASFPQEYQIDYVRVYADIVNTLPTVAITSPASGASVPAGNVTITADASDPDGSVATVEFWDGFTYLGEDTTAPYSFVWNSVPDGCYEIVARVIDNLGGVQTDTAEITVGTGCGQAPFLGSPFTLPTRIEAENYDAGGEGVAYHDTDASNNGGQYRPGEGVDIETCTDIGNGVNVGWLAPSEWIEYTVDVPVAGFYTLDTRVASESVGGVFHLNFNGTNVTGDLVVPVTGGWQTWTTMSTAFSLPAGTQTMRFVPTSGEFNVNYFEFGSVATSALGAEVAAGNALHPAYPNPFTPATTISYSLKSPSPVRLSVYDAGGRLVKALVAADAVGAGRHSHVWDGRDQKGHPVAAGAYFYRLEAGDFVQTRKMVVVR